MMPTYEVEVFSAWVVDAAGRRPQVAIDYPDWRTEDMSAQDPATLIPDPNVMVIKVYIDAVQLAVLEADARYLPLISITEVEEVNDGV